MSKAPVQSSPEPLGITPPPALGPPIIGTDPGSVAGIAQPVFAGGSATVPATPIPITGTPILPPPQVGFGNNALASPVAITPAPVPPSVAGFVVPQYASGSGTAPTAASLFPAFTSAGPSPPIVLNATQAAGTGINFPADWIKPPFPIPTTPGTSPIPVVQDGWGLYAGPNPATPFPRDANAALVVVMTGEGAKAAVVVDRDDDDDDDDDDDWPPKPASRTAPKTKPKTKAKTKHGHHRY